MAGELQKSSFVSPALLAVYDNTLLERIVPGLIWDKYGVAKTVPANSNTKSGFAMRYKGILPTTTQLAEYNGSIKPPVKIVREEVRYDVAHYGEYIRYTDELDLYDFRKVTSDFLNVLGDHAAASMEAVRRDALRNGTNVIYSGGKTNRAGVISSGSKISDGDIKMAVLKLKAQGAKKHTSMLKGSNKIGTTPIRACYIGVCSIYTTEDLRKLPGWRDSEEYAANGALLSDREVGMIGDVRFIENDSDEGIVTNNNGVLDENGSHVVEQTIIFGMDAYCTTTVRGKGGVATKVKPLGSGGTSDPLDQFGTIGWKAICGAAILNQAFMTRIEHIATDAVKPAKHYYDYS